ncbi:MAG: MAPEG family protein [Xanthobacteraceae bacterium]
MTIELWLLAGAVLLGFVHVGAQSFSFKAQVGNAYTTGPRDANLRPEQMAGRLERALRNYLETFPLLAAAVLIVQTSGSNGRLSLTGSCLYLVARALYLPAYAFAIPYARTVLWQLASIGIVLVVAQVFFPR